MRNLHKTFTGASVGLALLMGLAGTALARTSSLPLDQQVRHELLMLPYIGVFDNLNYAVADGVVTLSGQVVNPVNKSDAEQAVKSIKDAGVTRIDNQIEVLPLSPFDDRIRVAAFRTLLRSTPLGRYFWGPHPDIRIIVKNGNLTLDGTVLNESDRTQAYLVANGIPNVFSVTNNLKLPPPK